MNEQFIRNFILIILVACLSACASSKPYEREREPSATEMAEFLGCSSDEVAMCVDVNCEPEEWQCIPSSDFRDMFEDGEYPR